MTTIAFDISVLEIFLSPATGARVYIAQKSKDKEITIIGAGILSANERMVLLSDKHQKIPDGLARDFLVFIST
ncbi:hypothetical protein IFU39_24145 [Paenibacillus sp. CFBP 13594]|uniref:hypothetical protein n=1 Tax=Paenibacillus sp. CFBP 13594 TaxID=2774037 RepID=UPI00177E2161|nr:hypothetical protein [Paenibacillus sp. CFBP 13594]MBD8840919.1 hypothetical protein [Paenibacillus sp. CFBP 13594]